MASRMCTNPNVVAKATSGKPLVHPTLKTEEKAHKVSSKTSDFVTVGGTGSWPLKQAVLYSK